MKSRTKNICVGLLACACVSAAVGATVYSFRQTDGGYNFFSPQLKGDYSGGLTAFADGETQVTPEDPSEGTATFTPSMKGIISKNYDYLLVMANIDDVSKYTEVGFSYALGDGEAVSYMSNHYYDAIRFASGNLVPMTQIFGETCKGMIVYEFHYNPLEDTKITPVLTLREDVEHDVPVYSTGTVSKNENIVYNGNFETGDLSGWTSSGGEIVHVTSASTDFDSREYGKKGSYLIAGTEDAIDGVTQGNGLEGNKGTLVSSDFVIGGSGWITFRFGGGGNPECYVLVKDSEGNILGKYHSIVTPNEGTLTLYKADLSEHIGKTAHIEIVDNAESAWGCLTADNFITYYKTTGDLPEDAVEATNYLYQALNGDFETANLGNYLNGWTLSGEIGVISEESNFWGENAINNSSRYFRGDSVEGNEGTLTSSDFVVGGSGWITFKLGAAKPPACYITLDVKGEDGIYSTVETWHNDKFVDGVANADKSGYGLRLVQYKVNLSAYTGKTVRIVLHDEATGGFGFFTFDELITYYKTEPANGIDIAELEYYVLNGGFEMGDLTGWTSNGGEFVHVTSASYDFDNREYGKEGNYLIAGTEDMVDGEKQGNGLEGNTGTLVSSDFTIGGSGWITFRLGGGGNPECYVLVKDSEGNILGKYHSIVTPNEGTLTLYKADLSEHIGKTAHIEIVDNATNNWGCMTVDDFVTYYKTTGDLPETAVEATNYLYQALNGDFETANLGNYLNGWTLSGEIGVISEDPYFWGDKTINNSSRYFRGESVQGNMGTLTSSDFVVGGSGWITFKMGAAMPPACYITLQVKNDDGTYSTVAIWYNDQFVDGDANIDKPGYALRLVQYKADLNAYMGKTVRIVLNDEATAGFGFFTFDELITYYKDVSELPEDSINVSDLGYSVFNGGFETGDLTGWKLVETSKADNTTKNNIGYVSSMSYYWNYAENLYNREGNYLFTGIEDIPGDSYEGNTGTLTSSKFVLGGSGWITFRLAGGNNENCNILIKDEAGNTIAKYHNTVTGESGVLTLFKADLSAYLGKTLYIVVEDNASSGWGCMAVDDFVTYYESEPVDGTLAVNLVTSE